MIEEHGGSWAIALVMGFRPCCLCANILTEESRRRNAFDSDRSMPRSPRSSAKVESVRSLQRFAMYLIRIAPVLV